MSPVTTVVAGFGEGLKDTWFLMPNWKWIALATALLLGVSLLQILRPGFIALKERLHKRVKPDGWFSYLLQLDIHTPLAWGSVTCLWLFTWNALGLHSGVLSLLMIVTQILFSLCVLRLAYLATEALGRMLMHLASRSQNALDDQLVPFATKALKVVVLVLGALVILQNFGVNVVSLLAGLGLGGLALALAAQDTAANVFGSLMILTDRPFQVGDFIKVGDTSGTVEDVGFRSTRLRTPDNTLVTIPNSTMAKEKIENYQLRSMRRIRHEVGLVYGTPAASLEAFMSKTRQLLESHPLAVPNQTTVALQRLGDSALVILVQTYITTSDWNVEMRTQQEILLGLIRIAAECRADFAYPTQTLVHVLPPAEPVPAPAPHPPV